MKIALLKVFDSFSERKQDLRIVIFGPYEEMTRIKRLKDKLRQAGYTRVNYVEELANPHGIDDGGSDAKFASKKSKFYLGWSDVNLFLLFKDKNQASVAVEIEHMFTRMPERKHCADFLFEKDIRLETMIEGTIEENGCYIPDNFEDDDDLFEMAESSCWTHLTQDECEKTRLY